MYVNKTQWNNIQLWLFLCLSSEVHALELDKYITQWIYLLFRFVIDDHTPQYHLYYACLPWITQEEPDNATLSPVLKWENDFMVLIDWMVHVSNCVTCALVIREILLLVFLLPILID